jgi:hypothetical protein
MGKGFARRKKTIKTMFIGQMVKEVERLRAENKALKEDPNSVVGKFIGQFNDVVDQNQRLSALSCAMIRKQGDSVKITREEIEFFTGKRLRVNVNTEGEVDLKDATEYIFSYTATTKEEEEAAKKAATVTLTTCTDPNCTLPKDLVHTHDTPVLPDGELKITNGETPVVEVAVPESPAVA